MEFYNRGKFREVFIRDEPGSSNDTYAVPTQAAIGLSPISDLQHGVSGYSAIYFIVYTETIKEYLATGAINHPSIEYLENKFASQDVIVFNDLEIHYFSMPFEP